MTVESSNNIKFDIKSDGEDQEEQNILPLMSVTVSDDKLIELIVKHLPIKRRVLAGIR